MKGYQNRKRKRRSLEGLIIFVRSERQETERSPRANPEDK